MLSLLYTSLNIVAYTATYIVIWLKHFGNVALWAWSIWDWVRGLEWIPIIIIKGGVQIIKMEFKMFFP